MAAKKRKATRAAKAPNVAELVRAELAKALGTLAPAKATTLDNAAPQLERVHHWWKSAQPALRSAWLANRNGCSPEQATSILKSLGELYANAFKNLHGEEPTTAMPAGPPPGWD